MRDLVQKECEQIILYKYRYDKSISEIAKKMELNRKTITSYISLIDPLIQNERFDISNDSLIEKLSSYIIELKRCRRSPKTTESALIALKKLYGSLSDSKAMKPGEIYDIIIDSGDYNNSELYNLSYSTIYRALEKIKKESKR